MEIVQNHLITLYSLLCERSYNILTDAREHFIHISLKQSLLLTIKKSFEMIIEIKKKREKYNKATIIVSQPATEFFFEAFFSFSK